MNKNDEQYKIFKQVVHTFYHNEVENTKQIQNKVNNVIIEPKLMYDTFHKTLKAEFRIGNTQMYKIKSLPEFFERMLNHEDYKYGSKLEFVHTKEVFRIEDSELLNFILKYAEIIKYANETVGSYGKYMRTMSNEYITISNTGLDEIFDVLQNKTVLFKRDALDERITFVNGNPNIVFSIKQEENGDYSITPNIDVFSYDILKGSSYTYMLTKKELYRCDKEFEDTILKLLNIFRENYTPEIKFKRNELSTFCSLVYPKLKNEISLKELNQEIIEKYIPEDLYVKIYLDYDQNNYVTAEIRFVYGDTEFNPLQNSDVTVARDILKEDEYLDVFVNTGFMLDRHNGKLILANEDRIYNFLSEEIEMYMQKFEVLATDDFKKKEIHKPKIGTIGVKIENDLLKIDFSSLDFDINEIKEIMEKYTLKKKFHRLKDGSFLDLEENETMDFISGLLENGDASYNEIKKGEIKLPVARSLYLDRILQNMNSNIVKDENYKKMVNQVSRREISDEISIPKGMKVPLRNYQALGFKWLEILDSYKFGGILADDMGLRKNNTTFSCNSKIYRNYRKSKTKYCCVSKFAFS